MNMSSGQNFSMPSGGGDPSMHMRPDMMPTQQGTDTLAEVQHALSARSGMRGMDQPYMSFDMSGNNSIRPPMNMASYPPTFNTDSTSPPFHPQTRPWNMN